MRTLPGRLAAVLTALAAAALVPAATGATALPGCASGARVQGFHPDGSAAPVRDAVACAGTTGFAASEPHLRVLPDGTVLEEPAELAPGLGGTGYLAGAPGPRPQTQLAPAGIAVSRDAGRSWRLTRPAGLLWEAQDASLHVDRRTGRAYYYALSPATVPQGGDVPVQDQLPIGYAHLLTSGDGGRSWSHTQLPGFLESENPRFTTGPAPRGQAQPVAGESVAYWCGNTSLFVFVQRTCYRSLNGGQTWQQRSVLLRRGTPVHPECGSAEETMGALDGNYPQAGPDGALWVTVQCAGTTYLARSTDEGATFPVLRHRGRPLTVPAATGTGGDPITGSAGRVELRVDARGTLYAASAQGSRVLLRTSRDGGATWSAPHDLTPPAQRRDPLAMWALAVGRPGEVALAALHSRSGGYDGVLVATRQALQPRPVLVATTLPHVVTTVTQAKDDYVDVDLGPDGTAWAVLFSDCGADPACADGQGAPDPLAHATTVVRLRWP